EPDAADGPALHPGDPAGILAGMIENDSQNHFRWALPLAALVALCPGRARAAEVVEVPGRAQAQQLVALIDYVAADYPRAVGQGRVLVASEYAEQKALLADALELARALPAQAMGFDAAPAVEKLQAMAGRMASGEELAAAIAALRGELVSRYAIA